MKIIPCILTPSAEGPIIRPAEELPANAVHTVCDGVNYIVYEAWDELVSADQLVTN